MTTTITANERMTTTTLLPVPSALLPLHMQPPSIPQRRAGLHPLPRHRQGAHPAFVHEPRVNGERVLVVQRARREGVGGRAEVAEEVGVRGGRGVSGLRRMDGLAGVRESTRMYIVPTTEGDKHTHGMDKKPSRRDDL